MRRKEALIAVVGGIVWGNSSDGGGVVRTTGSTKSIGRRFGKITCREIEVVAHGRTVARINSRLGSGEMMLYSRDGNPPCKCTILLEQANVTDFCG